jgi:hypothetical protein
MVSSYLSNRSQFISINGGTSISVLNSKMAYLKDRVLDHFWLFYTCPNYSRFWKVTYLMPMLSPMTINCTFHSNQIQCLNNCLRLLSWKIVLMIHTRQQLEKVNFDTLRIGDSYVIASSEAKDPRFWLDSQMKCDTNVNRSCKAAFFHLFNIRGRLYKKVIKVNYS